MKQQTLNGETKAMGTQDADADTGISVIYAALRLFMDFALGNGVAVLLALWSLRNTQKASLLGSEWLLVLVSLLTASLMIFNMGKYRVVRCPKVALPGYALLQDEVVRLPVWRIVLSCAILLVLTLVAHAYTPLLIFAQFPGLAPAHWWIVSSVLHAIWTSAIVMFFVGFCKHRAAVSGRSLPGGLALLGLFARVAFVFCICEIAKMPIFLACTDSSLSISSSPLVIPIIVVMEIASVTALVLTARYRCSHKRKHQ